MDRNSPLSLAAAIFASVVGVFALMTMPIIISIYSQVLGFDAQQGGTIMIAEVAGGALASVLAIFWINRLNWRVAITIALIAVIGGNLLSSVQTDANIIAIIRFIVGFVGQGTAFAIGISMIGNSSDPDRNFGFVISTQVAFGVVALASMPFLVSKFESVAGMYVPLAALAAAGLLLVRHVPDGPAHAEQTSAATAAGSLSLPITSLIAMLIWCCGLGAMWGFVVVIGIEGGMTLQTAGFSLSVSSAVAITGSLAAATLAAKGVNRFLPVTIALLVQMAVAWLIQGEMNFTELVIKASMFQIFWNLTGPFFMGAIAASDSGGKISVLIPAAQTSGFFIGPAIVDAFMDNWGLVAVNYVAIACMLVALVIFIPLSARLKAAGY
jgi:predicted MFS family arabinose efflux permease